MLITDYDSFTNTKKGRSKMISLENIYKYYYSESSVTQALRNVNLEFSKGEFVAITGESSSGKTSAFKCDKWY